MFPFASMPENLAAFCALLRRHYGFHIDVGDLRDAARALEVVNIGDPAAVRYALRTVLSRNADDVRDFDRAFDEFFLDVVAMRLARGAPRGRRDDAPSKDEEGAESADARQHAPSASSGVDEFDANDQLSRQDTLHPIDVGPEEGEPTLRLQRSSYSPSGGEGGTPLLRPPDALWRGAAETLIARLRTRMSRRWRPAIKGRRFDFRRTLRSSLHTGADPVIPRWRARRRRHPRFVFLIDGSRSMGTLAEPALALAVALRSVTSNVEVFAFSTTIERITDDVRRAARGATFRLRPLHQSWGGGTRIGDCLVNFFHVFGDTAVATDTIVVVASDGLDVGSPERLRDAMSRLRRGSAAIIWINPLLGTSGYAPTALGMRTARPFVTVLARVADAADAARLARGSSLSLGSNPSGYDRM